jgi:hypothetical protein
MPNRKGAARAEVSAIIAESGMEKTQRSIAGLPAVYADDIVLFTGKRVSLLQ